MTEDSALELLWNEIKCKKCGEVLKPKEGTGLRMMDVILFVIRHIVSCGDDLFELTLKPEIKKVKNHAKNKKQYHT